MCVSQAAQDEMHRQHESKPTDDGAFACFDFAEDEEDAETAVAVEAVAAVAAAVETGVSGGQ